MKNKRVYNKECIRREDISNYINSCFFEMIENKILSHTHTQMFLQKKRKRIEYKFNRERIFWFKWNLFEPS